ncbi:MAG TPA: HIT domain-containing protein [Geminicoccaceae bacterium]
MARALDYRVRLGYPIVEHQEEQAVTDDGFALDQRIEDSSVHVADWPLCQIRLKDDARFHWLLLVPRRAGAVEYADLSPEDYAQLNAEVLAATRLLQAVAGPDKVNVAMLGNVVAQMHVHVIARFRSDPAWPDPVWCHGAGPAYPGHALAVLAERYAQGAAEAEAGLTLP